jgi:hypothetical protein
MSFENKNTNNRPSSKMKASINNNCNPNNNRENIANQKKKLSTQHDLKKELADAEIFLEKANKEFMNYKTKETKMDYVENNFINDSAIKFIEKTLEEKNILKKQSNNKIPLQQFLKENTLPNNSPLLETNTANPLDIKTSTTTSFANTNNNLENSNFHNGCYSSNPSRENLEFLNKDKIENLISKDLFGENNLMIRYKKQLKTNGFPEIGSIYCQTENDQELLFKFLDYVLIKKSNENGDKLKLKKTV